MPDLSSANIVLGLFVVLALASAGVFVIDAGSTAPDPVAFDETVSVGLTLEDEYALDEDVSLPRAQVFYSQFQYVVGYYGVETFVEDRRQPEHQQRFGYPQTVYVTDYGGTGVELNDEGYPTTERSAGWTDAESAWFVLESDARTPAGEAVVSFADRDEARAFADDYGGTIRDWETVLETRFDRDDATVARDRVDEHHQRADERVAATAVFAERPTSLVVGEDADTVQEAIDAAPENTTVEIPDGIYEETVTIDRPITLVGDGDVTLRGDGNGTVITATAERVAVQGVDIDGIGNQTTGAEELPVEADEEQWDTAFVRNYAGTDAGIAAYDADGLLVQDVHIETPASGIIAYESTDAVIRDVTVNAPDEPTDGLAGVLLFQSPSVVEDSTVRGGPNGVYLYRSPATVLRSNTVEGNQLGVHLMHTDETLIADNLVRDQSSTGIFIMTGPERNAVVGNTIRGAANGLSPGGSDTYIAENLIEDNERGLRVDTTSSIYENNVIAGNDVGADVAAILPTNRVVGNDFIENDEHATATSGPLRIWSYDGHGNYWQGGAAIADGDRSDRSYTPTDAIDKRLHRTAGTQTLVRAPALEALAGLEGSVPGMRTGSIVDQAPTCEPNNPDLLEDSEWADHAWPCYETTSTTTDD